MKKLVWIEGNGGRLHKMFLHKEPNNEHGWYLTEKQFNRICFLEPFGWSFCREDLEKINCTFVDVLARGVYCVIWED